MFTTKAQNQELTLDHEALKGDYAPLNAKTSSIYLADLKTTTGVSGEEVVSLGDVRETLNEIETFGNSSLEAIAGTADVEPSVEFWEKFNLNALASTTYVKDFDLENWNLKCILVDRAFKLLNIFEERAPSTQVLEPFKFLNGELGPADRTFVECDLLRMDRNSEVSWCLKPQFIEDPRVRKIRWVVEPNRLSINVVDLFQVDNGVVYEHLSLVEKALLAQRWKFPTGWWIMKDVPPAHELLIDKLSDDFVRSDFSDFVLFEPRSLNEKRNARLLRRDRVRQQIFLKQVELQSSSKKLKATLDDLMLRLAKFGLRNFKQQAQSLWERFTGTNVQRYKRVCDHFNVDDTGVTAAIPSINHSLALLKPRGVLMLVEYWLNNGDLSISVRQILDKFHLFPKLMKKFRDRVFAEVIEYQGSAPSSLNSASIFNEAKKHAKKATEEYARLSLWSSILNKTSDVLRVLDKVLDNLAPGGGGLPSLDLKDYLVMLTLIRDPTRANFLTFSTTPIMAWIVMKLNFTSESIQAYLFGEGDPISTAPLVFQEEDREAINLRAARSLADKAIARAIGHDSVKGELFRLQNCYNSNHYITIRFIADRINNLVDALESEQIHDHYNSPKATEMPEDELEEEGMDESRWKPLSGATDLEDLTPRILSVRVLDDEEVELQSGEPDEAEGVPNPIGWLERAKNSPLWTKLSALIYMTIGCTYAKNSAWGASLGSFIDKITEFFGEGADLLIAWNNTLRYIIKRIAIAWEHGDPAFLFEPDAVSSACSEMDEVLRPLMTKTFKGDPRLLLQKGDLVKSKYSRNSNPHVMKKYQELDAAITSYRGNLSMKRLIPLGIILKGRCGLGKTSIVERLQQVVKKLMKIPDDISITHVYTHTTHQSIPSCVHILVDNDVFGTNDKDNLQTTGQTYIDRFQTIVDSTPLKLETASLAEKANSYIEPAFFLGSTNCTTVNITTSTEGKDKLDRRYWIIEFSLKKDFISSKMTNNEDFPTVDSVYKWFETNYQKGAVEYKVGRMLNQSTAVSIDLTPKRELQVFSDQEELVAWMVREQRSVKQQQPFAPVGGCPGCTLPVRLCVCLDKQPPGKLLDLVDIKKTVELQGGAFSVTHKISGVDEATDKVLDKIQGVAMEALNSTDDFVTTVTKSCDSITDVFAGVCANVNELTEQTKTALKALTGLVICALSGYLTFKALVAMGAIDLEGATVGHVVNVPKPEDTNAVNYGVKMPWLGNSVLSTNVQVKDSTGNHIHAVWLKQNLLMLPRHLFQEGRPPLAGDEFTITWGKDASCVFKYDENMVWKADIKDLMIWFVPTSHGIFDAAADKLPENDSVPHVGYFMTHTLTKISRMSMSIVTEECATKPGDCGKPLVGANGMIYGIYQGLLRSDQRRLFIPVNLKDVRAAEEMFGEQGLSFSSTKGLPVAYESATKKHGFVPLVPHSRSSAGKFAQFERSLQAVAHVPLGHVPTKEKPVCVVESTPFRKFFPECPEFKAPSQKKHVHDPSIGGPEVPRAWNGAVLKRLRSYQRGVVDHKHMMNAVRAVLNNYVTIPKDRLQPMSLYHAICGSKHNVLINARDNSKAIGPTVRELYPDMTNEVAFKKINDTDWVMDERLKRMTMDLYDQVAGTGPLLPVMVKGARKAELKEAKKADAGDCRIFYVQDLHVNLVFRMIMLPLIAHIMSHPYESGVFGTLNAGSEQWKKLSEWLTRFSEYVFASDQKAFDAHHRAILMYYTATMKGLARKLGYNAHEVHMVGRVMNMMGVYVLELFGDFLYCDTMLNSGVPDTLVKNSVCQMLAYYYVLSIHGKIVDGLHYQTKTIMSEYVSSANTGDDNVTGFDPRLGITGAHIKKVFTELGYEVTNADKTVGDLKMEHISEITYLKRRFVKDNFDGQDVVLAPLEEVSILKSLCFTVDPEKTRGGATLTPKEKSSVFCCVREYFLHGKPKFDAFRDRIMQTQLVDFLLPTWDQLKTEYRAGIFNTWTGSDTGVDLLVSIPYSVPHTPEQDEIILEAYVDAKSHATDGKRAAQRAITELNSNQVSELTADGTVTNMSVDHVEIKTTKPVKGLRRSTTDIEMSKFFARDRNIKTFNVGTETAWNTSLYQAFRADAGVAKVLTQYSLFRGDAVVTLMVTGVAQMVGKMRLYAYPFPNSALGASDYNPQTLSPYKAEAANFQSNFCLSSQLPHVDIDLSLVGKYQLKLSWPLPYDYLASGDSDWVLCLTTINEPWLIAGETVTGPKIDVFVHYENVELDALIPQSGQPESRLLSRGLRYASEIASFLPFGWANPFSKIAELGAVVAESLGYSRLPEEISMSMVRRLIDNPNLISGQPDYSYTFAVDPAAMVSEAHSSLEEPGETDLRVLFARKSMIVVNWAQGVTIPAAPGVCPNKNINGVDIPYRQTTILSYNSSMFSYWNGSIKFCVEVVASPLLRGRLVINVVPPNIATPPAAVLDGSMIAHVFDIEGSSCFEVEVPYMYREPYQYWTNEWAITGFDSQFSRIVYYWLSPPPDFGASKNPPVNIYIAAGDDFTVGVPTLENLNSNMIIYESYVASKNPGVGALSMAHFGEQIGDLNQLAKRMSPLEIVAEGQESGYPLVRRLRTTGYWTFADAIAAQFYANKGSYRFKILGGGVITTFETKESPDSSLEFWAYMTRGWLETTDTAEVRVPDRNNQLFRCSRVGAESNAMLWVKTTAASRVYKAAGDDWTVSGFYCTPALQPKP